MTIAPVASRALAARTAAARPAAQATNTPIVRSRGNEFLRRIAVTVISGLVSVAIGIAGITQGGQGADSVGSFVLFTLSLPWTITVYIVTMFFNQGSQLAVLIALGVATFAMWRVINNALARLVLAPRVKD